MIKTSKFFKSRIQSGKYNFSMEKSEYFPIGTTFDQGEGMFNCIMSIPESATSLNRYFTHPIADSVYFGTISMREYERIRHIFIKGIIDLEKEVVHFNSKGLEFATYGSPYVRFPYDKAFQGQSFRVGSTNFSGDAKTLLVSRGEDGVKKVNYVFTFKTKFLPDLQKALLRGIPLKSKWFAVFITSTIPEIMNKNGFSNSFSNRFITPFETAGIEIHFLDKILSEIGFTEVPLPYLFSFESRARERRAIEMKNILVDFRKQETYQYNLQKDWDVGRESEARFTAWLMTNRSTILLNAFEKYIDEKHYSGITLSTGMVRHIKVSTIGKLQIFEEDRGWVESIQSSTIMNNLEVRFRALGGVSRHHLPELTNTLFDENETNVAYMFGGESMSVQDINIAYSFIGDDTYYEIADFKATVRVLHEVRPAEISYEGTVWRYDRALSCYLNNTNIITVECTAEDEYRALYITSLKEYAGISETFPEDILIYFWDVDAIYVKRNGLLCKFNINNLTRLRIMLQTKLVTAEFRTTESFQEATVLGLIAMKINNNLILTAQEIFHNTYYPTDIFDEPVPGSSEELDEIFGTTTDVQVEAYNEAHESARAEDDAADRTDEQERVLAENDLIHEIVSNDAQSFVDSAINGPVHEPPGHPDVEPIEVPSRADISESTRIVDEASDSPVRIRRERDSVTPEASDEPDGSIFDRPVVISDADSVQGEPIVGYVETDEEYTARTGEVSLEEMLDEAAEEDES